MRQDGQGAPENSSAPVTSPPAQPLQSSVPSHRGHGDSDDVDDFGLPIRKPPRRTYTDQQLPSDDNDKDNDNDDDDNDKEKLAESPAVQPKTPEPNRMAADSTNANVHTDTAYTHLDDAATTSLHDAAPTTNPHDPAAQKVHPVDEAQSAVIASHKDAPKHQSARPSEWSHQHAATAQADGNKAGDANDDEDDDDNLWQEMPAYATHTIYDDWGKVVAREITELDDQEVAYGQLGGAGKGYTKVQLDDDVQSATSMDEDTAYLFKNNAAPNILVEDDDDDGRDILSQMQATKDLLTESQRIAYVGLVRLSMTSMVKDIERLERTKGAKKFLDTATEAMHMWSQKMMVRLYSHMEIDTAEQIMIEQLAEHGVEPADLTPVLMQNARVKNPVPQDQAADADADADADVDADAAVATTPSTTDLPGPSTSYSSPDPSSSRPSSPGLPPAYEQDNPPDYLTLKDPAEFAHSKSIDLDLRWTVLCDLFLVLIADSIYDARSRTLLERVGSSLSVPWLDICRFEKRITDALEMQEAADKENWNEDDHMEQRKKSSRNRRLVMMGLATVGGGLVIGLSAGLLAPVIGAGLAAGFTTIGVAGTSGFLAGAGGAATITSTGVLTGGTIAVRASGRRTGAVKTFEYRPLFNNKRVNLIVTVAGWMTGKVDDVRLPFSTVDPIMGDMYSIFWEPEMLRSMGDTINILATEALTQGLQQILGSTILIALMSAMQLPLVLTKLSYLIDNPWAVSLARADMAGLILADSLIDRNLGVRPITLVGFSIGSRVIFSCLKELANRGAFGLIQNAYLFGSPMVVKTDDYLRAKAVVSGRFVNGYANNDWILGYLFRATSGGIMKVAGLAPVEIPGVENYDVTKLVPGHMAYRKAMPRLLREVGWMVDSDDFAEIEDPDPENHENRQRELINEIEEARRELEKKPEKRGLKALFSRNKKNAERKAWEVYDEQARAEASANASASASASGSQDGTQANKVLFDVDAIRAEVADLAAEGIQVREIKSTLPPMKLDLDQESLSPTGSNSPHSSLRQTRSFSGNPSLINGTWAAKSTASRPPYDYQYDHDDLDDSNISMTFETPDPRRPPPSAKSSPASASLRGAQFPASLPPLTTEQRPALYSSNTMPSTSRHANPSHNAWADDDEDEFGREKEVSMTFE